MLSLATTCAHVLHWVETRHALVVAELTPDSLVAIVFHLHVWVSLSHRIAVGLHETLVVERG